MSGKRAAPISREQKHFLAIAVSARQNMRYAECADIFERKYSFKPSDNQIKDATRLHRELIAKLRENRTEYLKQAIKWGVIDLACEIEQLMMLNKLAHDCVDGYDDQAVTKDGVVEFTRKDYSSAIRAMREMREIKDRILRESDGDKLPAVLKVHLIGAEDANGDRDEA